MFESKTIARGRTHDECGIKIFQKIIFNFRTFLFDMLSETCILGIDLNTRAVTGEVVWRFAGEFSGLVPQSAAAGMNQMFMVVWRLHCRLFLVAVRIGGFYHANPIQFILQ
ncbi:MAG: hypothetical protein HKL95_01010 [Phycisphaerae bacterium]|nr:hypothetical protein [Phycisphaerae bacterium]